MKDRKLLQEKQEISKMLRLADLESFSSKVLNESHDWKEEDEGLMEEAEEEADAEPEMGDEAPEMPDVDLAPEAPTEEGAHSAEDVADAIVKALQGLGLVDVVADEPEMTGDELPADEEEEEEETAEEDEEEEEEEEGDEEEMKMAHLQERVLERVKKRLMAEKVTENVVRRLKEMAAKQKASAKKSNANGHVGHPQKSGKNGLKPAPKAKAKK